MPLVERLADVPTPLSIDTYHADTARAALRAGAAMIMTSRPFVAMRRWRRDRGIGMRCVLMHMQGTPQNMQRNPLYANVVDDICSFFEERIGHALAHGIKEERIWLDPGFGFGRR